jgi:hypothetical protein
VVFGFDMLANHLGHPLTDPLRHLDRVRADPAELARLPDRYGAFLEPRVTWSPLYVYPPGATGVVRRYALVSTPPGFDPAVYAEPIEKDARRVVRVVSFFNSGATQASRYPTHLTELVQQVIQAMHPGIPFGPMPTSEGWTTSIFFRQLGFTTYGFSPVAVNITDSSRRHANDERIFLRDYLEGLEIFENVLEGFAADPGNKVSGAHPPK